MWTVVVARTAEKAIRTLPKQAAEKFSYWLSVVAQEGPSGLRALKSFHDEKLTGQLEGHRSSRLTLQWRVIYAVKADVVTVVVERVTPHVYRP